MIPKGLATAGTLAYVATAKYADGTPLYRLSKILDRYGIEIPRSTMASWMVMVSHRCRLIMEILQRMLKSGAIIHCDETRVQVLNEPGRANTADSYMWVFRGGDPDKPVVQADGVLKQQPKKRGDTRPLSPAGCGCLLGLWAVREEGVSC